RTSAAELFVARLVGQLPMARSGPKGSNCLQRSSPSNGTICVSRLDLPLPWGPTIAAVPRNSCLNRMAKLERDSPGAAVQGSAPGATYRVAKGFEKKTGGAWLHFTRQMPEIKRLLSRD